MRQSKRSRGVDRGAEKSPALMRVKAYACLAHRPTVKGTNLPQKIGRPGMAAVKRQYFLKQTLSLNRAPHSSQSLRAEKQRLDAIALGKIFVEQQHRRKRCGKVVDFGLGAFES